MLTKCEIVYNAVKSHLIALWIILSVPSSVVRSQEGKKKLQSLLQSLKSLVRVLAKSFLCITGLITRLSTNI